MSHAVQTRASSDFEDLSVRYLLEGWAERIPDAVALVAPGRTPLTYGRLWKHIGTVVHTLRVMGVARHDRVASVLPQGPEMATAFLAIAAGASSAPLNPAYRAHEFDFYLTDLNAKALILQAGLDSPARAVAAARGIPVIELLPESNAEAGLFTLTGAPDHALPICEGFAEAGDVALILHTSGTTSRPKSVPLTHTNICASARNIGACLELVGSDRCLNVMPLFHIHGLIGATLASLAAGSSMVCLPGFYAPQFFTWLDEFRPTWYTAVPTMHQSILARASSNHEIITRCRLRFIRSASAPLPPRVMAGLEQAFRAPVIEAYGMTEAAHQIASNPLPPGQRKAKSVGRAAGDEVAILDGAGNVLPAGAKGEIAIRGANVTAGYENNPEANARAFTNDWLRTGDEGFLDAEDYLFITGRLKEIINRGGEKVAPREVEEILMEHPAVAQAVVFALPDVRLGEEVAAVVVLGKDSRMSEREIRRFAEARLAEFKVPRRVLIVDEIPKGPTGKVQRVGLADKLNFSASDREIPRTERQPFAPPRLGLEKTLAQIWSQTLGVEEVGINDNFFALGGDSILAAQIIVRAREALSVELSFLMFIEAPTVAAMVRSLEINEGKIPAPSHPIGRRGSKEKELPLSFGQEQLWLLQQQDPASSAYNRPAFFRLTGRLNVGALEQSLNEIVQRHEILRSTVSSVNGQPFQLVSPHRPLHLPVVDLRDLSESVRATEARRLSTEEAERPINLCRGPLLMPALLRLDDEEYMLLLTIHHIAFDGWSQGVLLRELALFYDAFSARKPSPLGELPIQYGDYAVWQRQRLQGEVLEAHLAYWRKQLEAAPAVLMLPTDRPRPVVQTFDGAREFLTLPPNLTKALKTLSRQAEVSLFMTLLGAFQTLLYRYTGQTDICVGTLIANRPSADVESLIGYFVNQLVLRTDLSGDPSFRELLSRVREVCSGAYAHQELPFDRLLEELQPKRSPSHSPWFQVMLVLQNTPQPPLKFPGFIMERHRAMEGGRSNFDFTLELSEEAGSLTGFLEYNTALFDPATMRRMLAQFRTLLEGITANPDERLSTLNLDSAALHDPSVRRARLAQRQSKLSATQKAALAQRLRGQFGDAPAIADVAEHREQDSRTLTLKPITRRTDGCSAPLSFAQQRLWFLDQLEPGSSVYNMPAAFRMTGSLNVTALERGLNEIVMRHESLRTVFGTIDGEPVQIIIPAVPVILSVVDLQNLPETDREVEAQQLAAQEARRPFDLAKGPLFRASVLRLGREHHIFLITMHHIISDGWSIRVFARELSVHYQSFCEGRPSILAELPIQYADFAVWQRQWFRGKVLENQLSYWKRQLGDNLPVLELPTDGSRLAVQSYRGERQSLVLPEALSDALKNLSRREEVTLFMTLLAAFKTLLCRYTGQEDIVVGSPTAGRNRAEIEGLIGFFIGTLVLRTDLSGNPTFRELLSRVREVCLGAYAHQELPFEKLVEELHPERDLSRTPLFQVFFNMINVTGERMVTLPGLKAEPFGSHEPESKFDLTMYIRDQDGRLCFSLVYNPDLFDAATMVRMLGHYRTLLAGIVANPDQPISSLSILTQEERSQLSFRTDLIRATNRFVEFRKEEIEQSIPSRFEQQVERYPDHVAVKTKKHRWSYRELNRMANQAAYSLLRACRSGEERVGLLFENSAPMIAGIMAILKAGKTYVPLDARYPAARLDYMLQDSQTTVLLTDNSTVGFAKNLTNGAVQLINIDEAEDAEPADNPDLAISPDTLAYILYTSGSTGRPKGVMQNHRNVLHFIRAYTNSLHVSADDRLTFLSSYSHDAAVVDVFAALLNGATIYPWRVREDGLDGLAEWLIEEKATIYHSTPTLYQNFIEALNRGVRFSELRAVVLGGETVLKSDVDLFKNHFSPGCIFFNLYGSTESTINLLYSVGTQSEITNSVLPVGYPVQDTEILLLDEAGRQTEVYGEIGIRSEHVALGYLQEPEMTEAAFLSDPEGGKKRTYRTGDMGRLMANGSIGFMGRKDFQVKVRGFRIELEEIETILSQHPTVKETVVLAREEVENSKSETLNPKSPEKRLVAYVVSKQAPAPAVSELRGFLKEKLPDYMVPSAFVFLDRLPLTVSGKVDRKALPMPDQTKPDSEGSFVAPRDALELQLTKIWEKVLRIKPIGLRDNFFELGGHSLLAVRLLAQIEKVTGKHLPLASLFQAPAIEEQVKFLRREGWSAPWSSLVAIQPGGSKPPLFCVHAHEGNVLFYRALALRLGPEQPFYALQAHGLNASQSPHTRIEDMAAHYIKEIRTIQPEGPYLLGGYCFGGMVAFEMAQQLEALSQTVALVALFDSYAPEYYKSFPNATSLNHKLSHLLQKIHRHIDTLVSLGPKEKLSYIETRLKRGIFKFNMATRLPSTRSRREFLNAMREARFNYDPDVYQGRVTLFRATKQPTGYDRDFQMGWGTLTAGGLEIREVPGYYGSIVFEPNVRVLAEQLKVCLNGGPVG